MNDNKPDHGSVRSHQSEQKTSKRSFQQTSKKVAQMMRMPPPGQVHPALIPGVGIEKTKVTYRTDKGVLWFASCFIIAIIAWAIYDPQSIPVVGSHSLAWVNTYFSWLFRSLTVAALLFMLILGYGRTSGIRLGADDEQPEYSTGSWIAMMFSAGMGIGLLFFGPYEPLYYFQQPPVGFDVEGGSVDAVHTAMAQTFLHWGFIPWSFYALVGGAIAYNTYRRGRRPLISAIFEPLVGVKHTEGRFGSMIDVFAIFVTLFGTAVSLGIGALQIAKGLEQVGGFHQVGRGVLLCIIAVLSCGFILSAVSGISRGIRLLSNINMLIAASIALFVFIAGPTLFILNLLPSSLLAFFDHAIMMLERGPEQGPEAAAFLSSWTVFYWAWWISWTPFVGMFIARISRGRSLREFVTVVIMVPSAVCVLWFLIFGGSTIHQELVGLGVGTIDAAEDILFHLLGNLPLSSVMSLLAMVSITIFFVTSADSASVVMSSMSQGGRPNPSTPIIILWGSLLSLTAAALLVAGGENALLGLQSIMVVSALPFSIVLIGMMVAWTKDLRNDPYLLREQYAQEAIAQGIRLGIAQHGDDFVFGTSQVASDEGAGAWLDSEDPELTDWYVKVVEDQKDILCSDDVCRQLEPNSDIESKAEPDATSSPS